MTHLRPDLSNATCLIILFLASHITSKWHTAHTDRDVIILWPWPFKSQNLTLLLNLINSCIFTKFEENIGLSYTAWRALRAGLRALMTLILEMNLNTGPCIYPCLLRLPVSLCSWVRCMQAWKQLHDSRSKYTNHRKFQQYIFSLKRHIMRRYCQCSDCMRMHTRSGSSDHWTWQRNDEIKLRSWIAQNAQ